MNNFYKIKNLKIQHYLNLLIALFCYTTIINVQAEGTNPLSPSFVKTTSLVTNPVAAVGPFFDGTTSDQIQFTIANHTTENFYFGFSVPESSGTATSNTFYRILNSANVVVVPITAMPTSGNGFISNDAAGYSKAFAGPNIAGSTPAGYTPLMFDPGANDTYHIEIYKATNSTGANPVTSGTSATIVTNFFDFTVATTAGVRKNGRVFSQNWSLRATDSGGSGNFQDFLDGDLYSYTDDQTVVKVDFKDFQPLAFVANFNKIGVTSAGVNATNWLENRKSINGAVVSGAGVGPVQDLGYKTFLNVPDTDVFPIAATSMPFIAGNITGCTGNYTIPYTTDFPGDIKVVIELNGTPGYQAGSRDVLIEKFDQPAGTVNLPWDGKDGLGMAVGPSETFSTTLTLLRGRINMPVYDAEVNSQGFDISSVLPVATAKLRLFWDDSGLSNIGTPPFTNSATQNGTDKGINNASVGQLSPGHAYWSNYGTTLLAAPINPLPSTGGMATQSDATDDFGNLRVINTWFWALEESGSASNMRLPGCLDISGNVFKDSNGLSDLTINGGLPPSGINAVLVNTVTGNVIATIPVDAMGKYLFPDNDYGSYKVILSNTPGVVGMPAPTPGVPAGYGIVGENIGTAPGNDNTPDAQSEPIVLTFSSTDITNVNFGIEQPPTAGTITASTILNPGGTASATVPPATFSGADPDGTVASIKITAFPSNATSITINGTKYCNVPPAATCVGTPFPAAGIIVPAPGGVPTQAILVDPIDGATTVAIPYKTIDNAGLESIAAGSANVPFAATSITGNVFNDINGGNVDGNGTNAGGLNANLLDALGNVVASVPVNASGVYNFPSVNGGTYTVQISTNAGTVGSPAPVQALPTGWENTGDFNGASGTGTNASSVDGVSQPITATLAPISNINFGIEQPPTAITATLPIQANPNGAVSVPVTSNFGGNDPNGGAVTSIKITAFPSNATSITINGTVYTSATFPVGGVTVPTNAAGVPTQGISIDPIDGNVTVKIDYITIDAAGKTSAPAAINVPFVSPKISGKVFDDANGITDNTVNGTGTNGGGLNANLLDNTGKVVATVPVNADGTYDFLNVLPGSYTVQISTNAGTVGSPAPATVLPTGFVKTGENNGAGAGIDATVDSKSEPFSVALADVANINFGMEKPPLASSITLTPDVNPGGTVNKTITSNFSGTDADGTVDKIRITAFPSNATSITVNGMMYTSATFPVAGITIPATGGVPSQSVSIDPIDGNVTVSVPYKTIDNAGVESLLEGKVDVPFVSIEVAGKVFNDTNGATDNQINGTGTNGGGLNANLLDGVGNVIKTVPVAADGTYKFTDVVPGNYTVQINTVAGTIGMPAPVAALPSTFLPTGENNGAGAGIDGTVDSKSEVFSVVSTNVGNINFGIEKPPLAGTDILMPEVNPGGTVNKTITSNFSGTDVDGGTVDKIRITAFPIGATSITIGGTTYTSATFPVGGVTVLAPGGVPSQAISVDPLDGNVTVSVPYKTIDNAGKESTLAGKVEIPFISVEVSGKVFNDPNGATDGTVNGTGTNGGGLNANLLDGSGNVVKTVPVNADGTYKFIDVTPGNYTVQINATAGTIGSPAPAAALLGTFVKTGENNGSGAGIDPSVDSKSEVFSVVNVNISDVNFGIEQPPLAGTTTLSPEVNPGGTVNKTVTSNFSGTDVDGGTVDNIRITAFPTNATSITINGISYTSATFPVGGIIVPAPGGVPSQAIAVDPVDGIVTVSIPYKTIDNAGKESTLAGAVNVPFISPKINGSVFQDANGLTDMTVNGPAYTGANLNANLLDGAGNVVATVPVKADGTYEFINVAPGTYTVQLNKTAGTVGSPAPAVLLPGYVNTGENNDLPTISGSDGTVNSQSASFTVVSTDVANINFGIEQPPLVDTKTAASTLNPGGTNSAPVPASTFAGTDPDGTVTDIIIKVIPANATSITINGIKYDAGNPIPTGGVKVPAPGGVPTQPILVDPIEGAVTVPIEYFTVDNAGIESLLPGVANAPFTLGSLAGNVFDDANGLNPSPVNTVDGIGSNAGGLNANLLDAAGKVVATVPVSAGGTYTFLGLNAGDYTVQISTNAGTVGMTAPATALPTGWVNTGENNGLPTVAGTDGTTDGKSAAVTLSTASPNVTNVNFGIEQLPTAGTATAPSQINPGGTASATVPPATFSGTDPDGTVTDIVIKTIPANATSITINGVKYDVGNPIPANGITIPAPGGVPTQAILVDPVAGVVSVPIEYFTVDNAGKQSTAPGVANVPFTTLAISGSVFNDPNAGNVNNSTSPASTAMPAGLVAYVIGTDGKVVGSSPVEETDGSYSVQNLEPGTYTVVLSTATANVGDTAPAATPPTGFVSTGEFTGTPDTGTDGTVDGKSAPITLSTVDVIDVNFGIQEPPIAGTATAPSQGNPGGTISASVPPATFSGADVSGGTVTDIVIKSIPANATSITILGVLYNAGNPIPAAGITIPAPGGVPAVDAIKVDPIDGATTVPVQYFTKDNAGALSIAPGVANVPFTLAKVEGTVFNDPNAGNVNNSTGAANVIPAGLTAYLVDALGKVVGTSPVATDGTYSINGVNAGTYTVVTSTVAAMIGASAPAATPPTGFMQTGEFNGTPDSGTDGTIDGTSAPIIVGTADVTNVNFAIQAPPTAGTATAPSQVNPGGTASATVPPATFSGTDPDGGTVTAIIITAIPTNATSITINGVKYDAGNPIPMGGVTVPAPGGVPSQVILVDPVDGAVIVDIPYLTKDNAGAVSTVAGSAKVPFTSALPVDLITFEGKQFDNQINLTWKTANESNFSHFEIEKSQNAKEFGAIETIKATGKSIYNQVDRNPIEGDNYYRLKMVDLNGSYTLSKVISINFEKNGSFIAVENPAKNGEFLVITNLKNAKFTLLNSLGVKINTSITDLGNNSFQIKLNQPAAGLYFLNIQANGKITTKKVLVP